ncbi:hypothetical protein B0H14DRAFT_2871236 [Mycena olivaceomarginata]|nr:hypothetical protein B0H14DRAFT_2871236 [Mycena olivaceomarginata]
MYGKGQNPRKWIGHIILSLWLLPPSSDVFPIPAGILTTILPAVSSMAQQICQQNRGHRRACVDDAPSSPPYTICNGVGFGRF